MAQILVIERDGGLGGIIARLFAGRHVVAEATNWSAAIALVAAGGRFDAIVWDVPNGRIPYDDLRTVDPSNRPCGSCSRPSRTWRWPRGSRRSHTGCLGRCGAPGRRHASAAANGAVEGLQRETRVDRFRSSPSRRRGASKVQQHSQVGPAFVGRNVRHVAGPDLVGALGSNWRCTTFGAIGSVCFESVVRRKRRF